MKNAMKAALGLGLAVTLGLSTLVAASADVSGRPLDFSTKMTPSFPVADYAGAYLGTLHLNIASDGTVSGSYRAQDAGPVQPVVGGLDGDSIWFDIGDQTVAPSDNATVRLNAPVQATVSGPLQVIGILKNGRIEGSVQSGFSRLAFTAQQQTSPQRSE